MQYRLSVLIPSKNEEQRDAARRVVLHLRRIFPEGGSWIAAVALEPVLHGWWRSKPDKAKKAIPTSAASTDAPPSELPSKRRKRREDDRHILAWVEVWSDDEMALERKRTEAIEKIACIFRLHFADGLAEEEIYISSQSIDVCFKKGGRSSIASSLLPSK